MDPPAQVNEETAVPKVFLPAIIGTASGRRASETSAAGAAR